MNKLTEYSYFVEKNNPKIIYEEYGYYDSGYDYYVARSNFSQQKLDFFELDFDSLKPGKLAEIDESLQKYFKEGEITDLFFDFLNDKRISIDKKRLKECDSILKSIPSSNIDIHDINGVWLDESMGFKLEKYDQKKNIFIFSFKLKLNEVEKEYLLYTNGATGYLNIWCYFKDMFGEEIEYEYMEDEDLIESISKELEIKKKDVTPDMYHCRLSFPEDQDCFMRKDADGKKIKETYIKKFNIIKKLLEKLLLADKRIINEMIYMSISCTDDYAYDWLSAI